MPEIKNTFLGGKMNKDLDERLLPEGQYRDARNIEIATAEDSSVGTVRNILGNKRLENIVSPDFTCVGTIADEKNNKLYWFVSTYLKDAIIEYDIINDTVLPVVVDKNASNSKAVLRFGITPIITGINIIDNLLLWTDNVSDPKKINIDECKKGTPDFDTHTQLKFESGSFNAITLENVSNGINNDFLEFKPLKGKYIWFTYKQMAKTLGITGFTSQNQEDHFVRHYRNGKFLGRIEMTFFGSGGGNGSHGRRIPGETSNNDFHQGDILYGDDVSVDIEERHVTVVKPKPLVAPSVKINYNHTLDTSSGLPNLFETKFPRFSYRYKFRDGEFSTFAPFTSAVFNPRFPKDLNNSTEGNVFYNKDNVYDIKDPSNKAMINSIQSIDLSGFITSKTPEDVVEIDVLYKQENSSVIYSVKTIKHTDKEWHTSGSTEGYDLGYNQDHAGENFVAQGGYTKGKYVVTTENIYAALPANQLLRPWDNVPRRALAQEVTGNRIVYGNYLQNYNLGNYNLNAKVSYSDRNNQVGSFETQGLPSVKSQRNYQLGVALCDEHGRETPVLTSNGGALNIPWATGGLKNASRSLQLNTSVSTSFPEWVDSMKFFIKETSNEYYNLTMSRAWVTEKTYELDNSEGHIWISFPSSDRNKVAEGESIILKKKIGVGESQVEIENKFKIIDISNEAPNAIKYELINQGVIDNTSDKLSNDIFDAKDFRPDLVGNRNIYFDTGEWISNGAGIPIEGGDYTDNKRIEAQNIYMSWKRLGDDSLASQKYKVESGRMNGSGYMFKLKDKITQVDADVAHLNGKAEIGNTESTLHADLIFQIERKVLKTGEDFSGSFFVKISKNQITDLIESGNPVDVMDNYQVSSKKPTYFFRDDIATSVHVGSSGYGIVNYNGFHTSNLSAPNDIQSAANNVVGEAQTGIYPSAEMKVTDHAAAWDGILTKHGRTFFIDAMHMASGQSEASNYAKYNCVTWSGAGAGLAAGIDSAWSYPPLKVWLTDFEKSTELLESIEATADNTDDVATGLYYNNKLLSTSPLITADVSWNAEKVDGWVGPTQVVDRQKFGTSLQINHYLNHVNGLEGLVKTVDDHATGPRRWLSGITSSPTNYGAGVDTKTYSEDGELGRHFLHVSFLAPGEDLHDGVAPNDYELFGDDAIGNTLQGIWGGGHFTGPTLATTYGSGTTKHSHICLEGNNDDSTGNYLPQTPGPGIGFGYDLNYKEKHYRQWDPTFPSDPRNETRDFLRNLHPGAQFKFLNPIKALNKTVYTIKSVSTKKLYNHTNWRTPYNRYKDSTDGFVWDQTQAYKSVEENAITWLEQVDDAGVGGVAGFAASSVQKILLDKIKDFGKASNRRVCYIIELDKDPTASGNYNPLAESDDCTADVVNTDFCNIEFLDKVKSVFLSDLSKFPAIWETDPVKQEVDLDIYFEASNNIPVKLNDKTNEILAPLGSRVEMLNSPVSSICRLVEWNGTVATLTPGFPLWGGNDEINYSGVSFKFTKQDGSFVIVKADENALVGATSTSGNKETFNFESKIGENIRVGLAWNNCFSFGNGLESNRIRDDFNNMYLINGVKASTTTQKTYEEERRSTGMIYSGLYNSNSGVNDLNQFIMAEKITKDINPTFGSIQRLFQRRISLVAFCEDKVVSITSNKDAIYNADGNPQLISSNNVLGDANPFEGNYGISKNPESFASESYRAYFTDKNRGVVVRLSKDGLTPISSNGMSNFFRDNLKEYSSLIGTYDAHKQDYNLTLSHAFGENIIFNSFLESGGVVSADEAGSVANIIENPGIYYGTNLQYPHEEDDILTNNNYLWGSGNENLISTVMVTNHAEILKGSLQPYEEYEAPQAQIDEVITITPGALITAGGYTGAYVSGGDAIYSQIVNTPTSNNDAVAYAAPVYAASAGLEDSGNIYYPEDFSAPTGLSGYNHANNNLFGSNAIDNSDPNIDSNIRRKFDGAYVAEAGLVNSSYSHMNTTRTPATYGMSSGFMGIGDWGGNDPGSNGRILQKHNTGGILFNRISQTSNNYDNFVEFASLGNSSGMGNLLYDANLGTLGNGGHAAMYAGDEIEIRVEIKVWDTNTSPSNSGGIAWQNQTSWNVIEPFIQITDGQSGFIGTSDLQQAEAGGVGIAGASQPSGLVPINNNFYWQNWHVGSSGGYETGGSSVDGIAFSTDKFCSGGGSNNSQYKFPATTTLNNGGTQGTPFTETYTFLVRYKFKSSTQTAQAIINGSNTGYGLGWTGDFVDEKIVSDLRIRVGNYKKNATGYQYNLNGNGQNFYLDKLAHQKWEVSNVKVRKLLGIVAPSIEAVTGTFSNVQTGGDITGYTPVVNAWVDEVFAPDVSTVTTQFEAAVAGVQEVIAVPPQDVDAWTQVRHDGINEWTMNYLGSSGVSTSWPQAQTITGFGDNYGATAQTGYAQNFVDPSPNGGPGAAINYITPNGVSPANSPFNASTPYTDSNADGDGSSDSGLLITDYANAYVKIETLANQRVGMEDYISSDPWEEGKWYLVDVEYDQVYYPNAGDGTQDNGFVVINGVADLSGVIGNDIDSDSFGKFAGSYTGSNLNMGVRLLPTTRTEYGNTDGSGDNKSVLRGIFQFSANSYRSAYSARKNYFQIDFWDFVNPMLVQKIISRKLDVITTTGEADSWYHPTDTQTHSLSPKTIYWSSDGTGNKANTLCLEDIAAPGYGYWSQDFTAGNGPLTSAEGWKLKFTVTKNPRTNTFEGDLSMYLNSELNIANDPATTTPMSFGINVEGITAAGDYEVDFNFETSASSWVVTEPGGASNTTISVYPHNDNATEDNKVVFHGADGVKTICGIKDIFLGDKTIVLLGGTVGSWSWQGFNESNNNFITWEDTVDQVTGIQENRILFTNCPVIDPNSTLDQNIQISASQYIETPVNRYEHYTVSVDHGVNSGKLSIYYFNADGFGFRIFNLNSLNQGTVSTDVIIGDSEWNSENPVDASYSPEMKETFVIRPHGNSADVNGWIDNITMTRNFVTELTQNTDPYALNYVDNALDAGLPVTKSETVSFSEKTNGWTSFKSFVLENGVSLSSSYFTFKQGGLYKHYVPLIYNNNDGKWVDSTSALAENYNRFYDIASNNNSSLKAVLNEQPSDIKIFDTINYEGSQAYVPVITNTYDPSVLYNPAELTIANAQAWGNNTDVDGWKCIDITTNLEAGSIKNFIQKEGKWFGYIKGNALGAKLDTTRFSVQGLGKAFSVTSTPITISNN